MTAALSEREPATEQIYGLIERVTLHNEESGFCVLCPVPEDTGPPGGDHGHQVAALGNRWGMAGRRGLVGQGQGTRAAIQGEHHEDRAANHGRGDRAIPE